MNFYRPNPFVRSSEGALPMMQSRSSFISRRAGAVVVAAAMAVLTLAGPANAAPGDVTTFAGSGSPGATNGTGAAASFNLPYGMAADSGNLYLADTNNNLIRKIVLSSGAVSTLAGSGSAGSTNGIGTAASFFTPYGVAVDSGNLYVADTNNHVIRKVVLGSGVVSTLAGSGSAGSTNGIGTAASFNNPYGVAVDSGNLYVADRDNHLIRKVVLSTGVVSTLAGSGAPGFTNGTGAAAAFFGPQGVVVDSGNLYVSDLGNHAIRKVVLSSGAVSTVAGSGSPGSSNGIGTAASFHFPFGMAVDPAGNLYVADQANHSIRKVVLSSGVVSTVAGSGSSGSANGSGLTASFNSPAGVAVDPAGNIYVADRVNHLIRQIEGAAAGVSMVQPLPLLVAGFGLCVGGVIVQTRRRRSSRPTLTPSY
jgi:NHL repeat